jgi:hypothetical protein
MKLKILCLGSGGASPFDNTYIVEYDPTRWGRDPHGRPINCHLVVTDDPTKALQGTFADLLELWRKSYGVRDDGKPNRPLTAFTVMLEG